MHSPISTVARRARSQAACAIGERLSRAEKRKLVELEEMQSLNERRVQALADIESALRELDGGALGTLADRVRAIPGLVRARALRANADYGKCPTVKEYDKRSAYPIDTSVQELRNRCDRLETIVLALHDAEQGHRPSPKHHTMIHDFAEAMRCAIIARSK